MEGREVFREWDRIRSLIRQALEEDLGGGDVTTRCIVPEHQRLRGTFTAKEEGIIAGLAAAEETFALLDEHTVFSPRVKEGEKVSAGQVVAEIEGRARTLLSGERTALNLLQRMSGIATKTRRFVEAAEGTSTVILDTRKTAPGLRVLDKKAVKLGGGENHRFGLYDMVLIKENHITAAGSITEAVRRVRTGAPRGMKIEVEVQNLEELRETLALAVDRILLDNMTPGEMARAVQIVRGRIPLEASGNITLERMPAVAASGVDYVSVGGLTHSVRALDITLILKSQGAPAC